MLEKREAGSYHVFFFCYFPLFVILTQLLPCVIRLGAEITLPFYRLASDDGESNLSLQGPTFEEAITTVRFQRQSMVKLVVFMQRNLGD